MGTGPEGTTQGKGQKKKVERDPGKQGCVGTWLTDRVCIKGVLLCPQGTGDLAKCFNQQRQIALPFKTEEKEPKINQGQRKRVSKDVAAVVQTRNDGSLDRVVVMRIERSQGIGFKTQVEGRQGTEEQLSS